MSWGSSRLILDHSRKSLLASVSILKMFLQHILFLCLISSSSMSLSTDDQLSIMEAEVKDLMEQTERVQDMQLLGNLKIKIAVLNGRLAAQKDAWLKVTFLNEGLSMDKDLKSVQKRFMDLWFKRLSTIATNIETLEDNVTFH